MPPPRSKSSSRALSSGAAVLVFVASCALFPSTDGVISSRDLAALPALPTAPKSTPTPKVLVLGIDGLLGSALEPAATPNLDGLAAEGSVTLRGQSGDLAKSGANWSSVLTGVWRDRHGVDANHFLWNHLDRWPDLFARLEQARPEATTAFVYSWKKLHRLGRAADLRVFDDFEDCGDGCTTRAAVDIATRFPVDLLFVYLLAADHAGHTFGFGGDVPEYRAALEEIDGEIGAILAAIRARPTYPDERWLVLVTTDHGGGGPGPKKHGANQPSDRDVYFGATELDASAAGPLEFLPAPRQVDVAPTILAHLGAPAASWTDDPRGLDGMTLAALAALAPKRADTGVNQVVNAGFELDRGQTSFRVDVSPLGWREFDCALPRRRDGLSLPARPDDQNVLAALGERACVVEQSIHLDGSGGRRFTFSAQLGRGAEAELAFFEVDGGLGAPPAARLAESSSGTSGCGSSSNACRGVEGLAPPGAQAARVRLHFSGDAWVDDVVLRFPPSAEEMR